ncbi:hypothetical protein Tco_0453929 [Tanacetum coccineum]
MKKFPDIPQRVDEYYHSIKDDTPLVSMYTTGNVLVRGMLIPDAFLTKEIRATDDFKEYEMVFVGVDVLMNQLQLVVSSQGTHRSTPRAHRTPTVSTASPHGKKRKQIVGESSSPHKSLKITIRQKQVVEGEKDDDDSEDRLEPGNHKENPEYVDDDDDEEKVIAEKDVNTGSLETRTEEMHTPIPTPPKSPRINFSSDKNITQELTDIVPLPTATTSKDSSTSKRKKQPILYKTKILPGSIAGMCRRRGQIRSHIKNKFITHDFLMGKIREVLDHCNTIVPELTFAKTNEMINKEMTLFG